MKVSRYTAIENVNRISNELSDVKNVVETWKDAFNVASIIAHAAVRHVLTVYVEMNIKDASTIVDKIMLESHTIECVISKLMDLIFDGITSREFFDRVYSLVREWFKN